MKRVLLVLCALLCSCEQSTIPIECKKLADLISEQRVEVERMRSGFKGGEIGFAELGLRIGAMEERQLPIIDRCVPHAMNAGPKCREFHEAAVLRDVTTMLHATKTAGDGERLPSREFVNGMLDVASGALAKQKNGTSCFK